LATTLPEIQQNMAPGVQEVESAQTLAAEYWQRGGVGPVLAARVPALVKGKSMSVPGAVEPLRDPNEIMQSAYKASLAIVQETQRGIDRAHRGEIAKAFNPQFISQFGNFLAIGNTPFALGFQGQMSQLVAALQDTGALAKNFSLQSPLASGLVPFDLLAPSRLLWPFYTPLRNKVPRVPGQGTSRRFKPLTGIPGSQTGANGAPIDISMSEFPSGQNFSNWPLQLPASGPTPTAFDVNIPYQFFGTSEAVSFLAQVAGQGFEDISALANLVLLQKMMLGEEYMLIAGTGTAVSAPAAPTLTARTAGSNETPLSGVSTNVYVRITATNYYGETTASAVASVAPTSGQVVDVSWQGVRGALQYNIYIGTGTADPGVSGSHLMASGVGGVRYTLQGAIPTSTATPPTSDTGTAAATRYEGMKSVIDGHASLDASVYPSGFQGAYANLSVGTHLSISAIEAATVALWDGKFPTGSGQAFRADPAELICEGSDARRLSDDILNQAATNFRIFVQQNELQNVRVGQAVTEFVNPVTRNVIKILVHPFLTQGTAFLLSYTLPMTWTNVPNVWENTLVQDYLSISWPVIDLSYRYSIVMYGALVCQAPQYNAVLSGLQVSDTTPYS
jgi:hypothetical protein